MRAAVLVCAALLIVFLAEGQSGAHGTALPALFNQVRHIDGPVALKTSATVRVMTWNIDRGTERQRIRETMADLPADVYLLQEVDWNTARANDRDVAADLAHELHLQAFFGIEFEELSQERSHPAYIGQATLTSLPVTSARVLRFERQSGFWKPRAWMPSGLPLMQRRIGNRIALVSELMLGNQQLVVYNAHLESRSAGMIQSQQLDEILRDAQRYPRETAVIIGGDLNTKYLASIFLHKLERAGYRSALGEHIERTHRIAMALDWIYARGPIRLSGGEVRRDVKGSDHYPVYVTLSRSQAKT